MTATIINAAPMVIDRGTQDLSTRLVPREPEPTPQHCAKTYLYTQKGPTTPQLVVGGSRTTMYGADSFDLRKKWANHATVFSNAIDAQANAQMIERIVPEDAGPESNILLSLDVLPTTVDLFERNIDGSIKLDSSGEPIKTGTTPGVKVKWVVTSAIDAEEAANFGAETIKPGDQTDTVASTQSQRYPILQLKASSVGEWANNSGIRIWAPLESEGLVNSKLMSVEKAYAFRMAVVRRLDASSSSKVIESVFGEQAVEVTLKPGAIDPNSDAQKYVGDVFINSYQQLNDARFSDLYGDFGQIHVYDNNIKTLLSEFYQLESEFIDEFSDFTGAENEEFLFNIFGFKASSGSPYHAVQMVSDTTSTMLSQYTNIWAQGGSDGTMDDESFAQAVSLKIEDYANPNSQLMDLAYHVESIFYDSGFPLQTKKDLTAFITNRKDTFLVLSTHTSGEDELTASEENSLAVALRTRLAMAPESDYFGTPVMRGMIIGRSGDLRNSQWTKKVPASIEVAIKSARYMGNGSGRWRNGFHFDGAPGSILDNVYNINVGFTSATVRNKDWDAGLNWVQTYDRRSLFFPALKTVYTDDTSVLNSYFTAMAIAYLNKIAHAAWREFSGISHLTPSQLVDRVNEYVNSRVTGIFDNRFVIEPAAFFTQSDSLRGYSWTLPIKIFSPSQTTVMTTYVQAYRISDLEA